MTTNLTLFTGNAPKIALKGGGNAVAAALKNAATQNQGTDLPDGGVYISFSGKMGTYSIGTEKEDADPNEFWLVNIFEFQAGWMCWKGGSPVAKRLASIFGEPVETPDFKEHSPFNEKAGEGWQAAKAMMLRSLNRGIQGYYSTSTKSAVREFAKLEAEIARRLEEGLPCWPIINFGKTQFKAQGNTNWKPVLEVAGWVSMIQVQKMAELGDNDAVIDALDDLVSEANDMAERGIPDPTSQIGQDTGEDDADDADDDGIEDADIVEEGDDADDGEAEDGDDDEEAAAAAEEVAAAAAAEAEAKALAARKAKAQQAGGLKRRALGSKA